MLHSKPFATRIFADLSDAARGATTLRVVPRPEREAPFDETRETRKWAAIYALCRQEELLRERLRLEAEATGLGARTPRPDRALRENALRRRLVAARLDALGALAD